MSVTVTIENNLDYCRAHRLTELVVEDCCHDAACPYCAGSNRFTSSTYPFELNISNGNFSTLWSALGLEVEYCGSLDARQVARAIASCDAALIQRANYCDGESYFSFGITEERATRYLKVLAEICAEAERREERVVWY